jgi:anti-anti-sigma regulatory factor
MQITTGEAQGKVPITIIHVQGELDASNYERLIARARQAHEAGARDLLIDLSGLSFMASSGLVALHSIALLMRGETPPDPTEGWGALRSIDREREGDPQQHVKLLNPQPKVERVLKMAGFDRIFEIHTDQETAIASF